MVIIALAVTVISNCTSAPPFGQEAIRFIASEGTNGRLNCERLFDYSKFIASQKFISFDANSDPAGAFEVEFTSFPVITFPNEWAYWDNYLFDFSREFGHLFKDSPEFKQLEKIIQLSGRDMHDRRGWSQAFNQSRLQAAEKTDGNLDLIQLQSIDSAADPRGSIGISVARKNGSTPEQRKMPMHDKSEKWSESLNKALNENAILIEPHTFWINDENAAGSDRIFFAQFLRRWLFNSVHTLVNEHPELLDKEIIYTYGDDISLRMYGRNGEEKLGFIELTEKEGFPKINFKGTEWTAIRTTPRRLLSSFSQFTMDYTLHSRDGKPFPVRLPDGRVLSADGNAGATFTGKKNLRIVKLAERFEVMPGIWARHGAYVTFHQGRIIEVSSVEGASQDLDAQIVPGLTARPGAEVTWTVSGDVKWISNLSKPIDVKALEEKDLYPDLLKANRAPSYQYRNPKKWESETSLDRGTQGYEDEFAEGKSEKYYLGL